MNFELFFLATVRRRQCSDQFNCLLLCTNCWTRWSLTVVSGCFASGLAASQKVDLRRTNSGALHDCGTRDIKVSGMVCSSKTSNWFKLKISSSKNGSCAVVRGVPFLCVVLDLNAPLLWDAQLLSHQWECSLLEFQTPTLSGLHF